MPFTNIIDKPSLIISKDKVARNIDKIISKVENIKKFRPHFKTHQSFEIGEIFRKKGVDKITVSSVDMAEYFSGYGWDDITIALLVNIREINKINNLAGKITLNLLVESVYVTRFLEKNLQSNVNIFIKIDTGYHRTGLLPNDDKIFEITKVIKSSNKMSFAGFLTHAGNTYKAKGRDEVLEIMDSAYNQLNGLKKRFIDEFPQTIISYGDTPSCSMATNCDIFDEIRPGNFVYYDIMQYHIGSCTLDDIAVAVACPVVALHPGKEEMVVYGGAVHLSKESLEGDNGFKTYGYIVNLTDDGWTLPIAGAYVSNISQEHGIIKMPEKELLKYKPGDLLGILPVHSCLTANLLDNQIII